MAKVIKIDSEFAYIGDENANLEKVLLSSLDFQPQLYDEVAIYKNAEEVLVVLVNKAQTQETQNESTNNQVSEQEWISLFSNITGRAPGEAELMEARRKDYAVLPKADKQIIPQDSMEISPVIDKWERAFKQKNGRFPSEEEKWERAFKLIKGRYPSDEERYQYIHNGKGVELLNINLPKKQPTPTVINREDNNPNSSKDVLYSEIVTETFHDVATNRKVEVVKKKEEVHIEKKTNGWGVAGFIFSLINILFGGPALFGGLLFFICGFVFSFLGLTVYNPPRQSGKGLAKAGLWISAINLIWTLIWVLIQNS